MSSALSALILHVLGSQGVWGHPYTSYLIYRGSAPRIKLSRASSLFVTVMSPARGTFTAQSIDIGALRSLN